LLIKGIVKKIDPQGFGIIEATDGSKLPFILADLPRRQPVQAGLKVIFSTRKVKDKVFASHIFAHREALNEV